MNILIVSYFYYPENTPRAFRTHELVKEFLRRGYVVDLIIPNKEVYKDQMIQHPNLNYTIVGKFIKENKAKNLSFSNSKKEIFIAKMKALIKPVYNYLHPMGDTFSYSNSVYRVLKNRKIEYRLLISIAFPFSVHLGVARAIKANKILVRSQVKIAEYSDPFYFQEGKSMLFLYKFLDTRIGKVFDFIVVPTEKAINTYLNHKSKDKIAVIPQGFDFSEIEVESYVQNQVPTFAYAGVFYEKIRNPEILFNHLFELNFDYRFVVFAPSNNTETEKFLKKFKKILGNKLTIQYNVPRLSLIKELSKMDFLVNLDNSTSNQTPSKLIDYTLSGRPIFNCTQSSFDTELFKDFLDYKFDKFIPFDIRKYNITNVVDSLISLKKNEKSS